ncbi:MAG: AAA family ATPase [Eubacteriales bacterium]|nr:AAA family ATPase [Eubacteriales bacterium]
MNIREAKEEIIHTVRAYLDKDETGAYTIPPERQRPILLMGPPGIGKTAIMEQVAQECGIGLVSYTITHHTRQSAIGLPYISRKMYGGKEYSVTEYTMSEIIAAVYDQIEATGIEEGILFLDEINCVSETLAPTMLQFLQYKTFGTHHIPDGFLIVTAGNPPQYNKSVRDFDIVTLDRLRRIDIEEDFAAFKEYASRAGLHGAVMAYLGIRNNHFYSIRTEVEGRHFVTARGWEDLSRTMQVHEKNGLPVNEQLAVQFLQDPEIARSFAAYYDLYRKYSDVYRVPDILAGRFFAEDTDDAEDTAIRDQAEKANKEEAAERRPSLTLDPVRIQEMQDAPFDEKLSLISLLIDALGQGFAACALDKAVQEYLMKELGQVRAALKEAEAERPDARISAADEISARSLRTRRFLQQRKDAGLPVPREEERVRRTACKALDGLEHMLREQPAGSAQEQYAGIRNWFSEREQSRREHIRTVDRQLTNTFRFLSRVYGEGQEMVLFLTELSAGYYSLRFLNEHGNDAWFRYNRMLLLQERRNALRDEVLRLME